MNNVTFGDYLRSAREEKNLSYEDVYKATKITRQVIIDLESMNTSKFPPEAYLRGLIRSYCSYLGINPHEVFDLIKKNELQSRHLDFEYTSVIPEKRRRILGLVRLAVVCIIVIGVGVGAYVSYDTIVATIGQLRTRQRERRVQDEERIARISNLEEREFMRGERFILESDKGAMTFELVQTNPAVLRSGDDEFVLADNQVVFFNVDDQGEDDFAVFSRGVSLSNSGNSSGSREALSTVDDGTQGATSSIDVSDTVVLRIDPNIYQDFSLLTGIAFTGTDSPSSSVPSSDTLAIIGIPENVTIDAQTVATELVFEKTSPFPFTLRVRSLDDLYVIVEYNQSNQSSQEQVVSAEQELMVQLTTMATFYLAHTSTVEFFVNDVPLPLGNSALPQSFVLVLNKIDSSAEVVDNDRDNQRVQPTQETSGYILKKIDVL